MAASGSTPAAAATVATSVPRRPSDPRTTPLPCEPAMTRAMAAWVMARGMHEMYDRNSCKAGMNSTMEDVVRERIDESVDGGGDEKREE